MVPGSKVALKNLNCRQLLEMALWSNSSCQDRSGVRGMGTQKSLRELTPQAPHRQLTSTAYQDATTLFDFSFNYLPGTTNTSIIPLPLRRSVLCLQASSPMPQDRLLCRHYKANYSTAPLQTYEKGWIKDEKLFIFAFGSAKKIITICSSFANLV